jgi:DNA-binding response OmpR family regulator
MKILIADDDVALTHMLSARLKAIGFKPITAQDAVQAWLAIFRNVPAVVILDLHMPAGTGRAVLKSLKMSTKTSHIPVIAISGLEGKEIAEEVKALGADIFMPKPLDLAKLDQEVQRLSGALPTLSPEERKREGPKPLRVLVADDDAVMLRVLETLLPQWDYQVLSANNGGDALKAMEVPEPPQIAVLDWMMPVKDGLEVCTKLRQRIGRPYTYVILLTAKGEKQELVRGMEAGADDYIVKPFDVGELKVRLGAGRRIIELQDDLLSSRAQVRSALRGQGTVP